MVTVFRRNVPQIFDHLNFSQGDLLNNNRSLDQSFGVDHYTFSNATANNGKHNQLTTPKVLNALPTASGHPNTIAAEPKIYAMQDSDNLGVLNYSRGPLNAVPTPLTSIQSSQEHIVVLKNQSVTIFDFEKITLAIASLTLTTGNDPSYPSEYLIFFGKGTSPDDLIIVKVASTANPNGNAFKILPSKTKLIYKNTGTKDCYLWYTLKFHRTSQ